MDSIPILHKLEQVSSDERIGSLAENLMEVLRGHEKVKAKVRVILGPLGFGICIVLKQYLVDLFFAVI